MAPPLLLMAKAAASGLPDFAVDGDMAVTELAVREAAAGTRLLGPYSRFAFNHPGPLPFYLLVPGYILTGESFSGLLASALLLNALCAAALLAVVWLAAGRLAAAWAGVMVASCLLYLGPDLLHSVWNPNLSLLPFALAVVAATGAATARPGLWPVAVVAGSLALQCHVAYALPLAFAGVAALASRWRRVGGRAGVAGQRSGWRFWGLTCLLALVLWAPVLVEEAIGRPGNLSRLARFFAGAGSGQSLAAAADVAARVAGGAVLAPFGTTAAVPLAAAGWPARAAGLALAVALVAALVRARREGEAFVTALALACLGLLAASAAAVTRIVGPLEPYLLRWIAIPGVLGLLAVLLAFARPRRRGARSVAAWLALLAVLALSSAGLMRAASFAPLAVHAGGERYLRIERLAGLAAAGLERTGATRPRIGVFTHRVWDTAAGLALRLAKRGHSVGIDPAWQSVMGRGTPGAGGPADSGIVLCAPAAAAELAAGRGVEHLGGDEHVAILMIARPATLGALGMAEPLSVLVCSDGFYGPEAGRYRWSQGWSSRLAVPLIAGTPYDLEVVAAPIGSAGRTQTVGVSLNRVRIGDIALQPGSSAYRLALPATVVADENELRFDYAFTEVPGAKDPRELAVRFESLELTPSPAAAGDVRGGAPGRPVRD